HIRNSAIFDFSQEKEELSEFHLPIEAALFGEIPDCILGIVSTFSPLDRPGVRQKDAGDHADGSGFTGPVPAEEAGYRSASDGKGNPIHRADGAEGFHDVIQREYKRHTPQLLSEAAAYCTWSNRTVLWLDQHNIIAFRRWRENLFDLLDDARDGALDTAWRIIPRRCKRRRRGSKNNQ